MIRRLAVAGVFLVLATGSGTAAGDGTGDGSAADELRQRYEAARAEMSQSDFGRPMVLESSDADRRVRGDVLAELDQPIDAVSQALEDPRRWCEIMLLTPSISRCEAQDQPPRLAVRLSRRYDQSPDEGVPAEFAFHPQPGDARYTAVGLGAERGPLGTSDYRIEVEALALDDRRTVLHMAYSYRYGLKARLATKAYLATKGRDKVGFTHVDGGSSDARVGGMRGSVERNAMRYYLAIEANVAQAQAPDTKRMEASLDHWLKSIARFPRQLAESDPDDYRRVKRERFAQQAAAAPSRSHGGMRGRYATAFPPSHRVASAPCNCSSMLSANC